MISAIYFDLDGVLCDFVRGAFAFHGKSIPMPEVRWDFPQQIGFAGTWASEFWDPLGEEFWANLAPLADGMALLRAAEELVGERRIGILSSPCQTKGCRDGKHAWVEKHLPAYATRAFLGADKYIHAAECKLLVDDHGPNCDKFIQAGGRALLVPRPWNDLRHMCDGDGHFDPASLAGSLAVVAGKDPRSGEGV